MAKPHLASSHFANIKRKQDSVRTWRSRASALTHWRFGNASMIFCRKETGSRYTCSSFRRTSPYACYPLFCTKKHTQVVETCSGQRVGAQGQKLNKRNRREWHTDCIGIIEPGRDTNCALDDATARIGINCTSRVHSVGLRSIESKSLALGREEEKVIRGLINILSLVFFHDSEKSSSNISVHLPKWRWSHLPPQEPKIKECA